MLPGLDASIAGSMALMCGVVFWFVCAQRGWLATTFFRRWSRCVAQETLAVHLLQAELSHADDTSKLSVTTNHML